jgi:hypothetical protein
MKATLALIMLTFPCFAARNLADFPLRVEILQTHWTRNAYGTTGSGRGNITDAENLQGFDFTFECSTPFNATQGSSRYSARWKKQDTRLSLLTVEIGNTQKQSECELKTTLFDGVYGMVNGNLVSYTPQQYADLVATRQALSSAKNPLDTDPANFPLKVTILESKWQRGQAGGNVGDGRGNVRNGDSIKAFEFSALCYSQLSNSISGTAYSARWESEPTRLLVLSHAIGTEEYHQCKFKTDVHPTHVYTRNTNTGVLNYLTQDEYKTLREKRRAEKAAALQAESSPQVSTPQPLTVKNKLTNDDVIVMVSTGLSADIVIAKIEASECAFDTTLDGLRRLKAAKVPNAIVIGMIKKSGS